MSEELEAKRDGAKLVKNSGRGQFRKGDAMLGDFTIDYKEYAKSFSLSEGAWAKICTDAFRNGNTIPALKVILGGDGAKTRLFVIGESTFHEMHEAWKEKYASD